MDKVLQSPTLRVENLNVYYHLFHAVKGVSFEVQGGEIFGLLGPNGAGKTSTLSAIEGLITPRSGKIWIAGFDIQTHGRSAKANMGVQLQSTSFQPELTIMEIIRLYGGLYGMDMTDSKIERILEQIKLTDSGKKKFSELSGGQQQRVSLSISTMHNPILVLLDEPTTGLDPQSRRQLWERYESMKEKGHAIVLTTHSMEEAEAVCDRIAIIDHGRIIVIDTPENLIESHRHDPAVISASRKGKITLEDVFIGLTGTEVRT